MQWNFKISPLETNSSFSLERGIRDCFETLATPKLSLLVNPMSEPWCSQTTRAIYSVTASVSGGLGRQTQDLQLIQFKDHWYKKNAMALPFHAYSGDWLGNVRAMLWEQCSEKQSIALRCQIALQGLLSLHAAFRPHQVKLNYFHYSVDFIWSMWKNGYRDYSPEERTWILR